MRESSSEEMVVLIPICAAAEALLGPNWSKPQLAFMLDWDLRRVQRWCSGQEDPHPKAWARLLHLLRERQVDIHNLLTELERPDAPSSQTKREVAHTN